MSVTRLFWCPVLCALGLVGQAQAFDLRVDVGARTGAEGIVLQELSDVLTTLSIAGFAYDVGLSVFPYQSEPFELEVGAGVFGFAMGVDLEQRQFGQNTSGRMDVDALGAKGHVGGRYRVLPPLLDLLLHAHFDYGFSGNVKSEVGFIDLEGKVGSLTRYGVEAGVASRPWMGLTTSLTGGFFLGAVNMNWTQGEELGNLKSEIPFHGYRIKLGLGWTVHDFKPKRPKISPRQAPRNRNSQPPPPMPPSW